MRLSVEHFLGLRKLDWSPEGVSLLVGPNGAGKTTVLDALDVLANTYRIGVSKAARCVGPSFKHLGASPDVPVVLELSDTDSDCHYRLEFTSRSSGIDAFPAERGLRGDQVELFRLAGAPQWSFLGTQHDTQDQAPDRSALRAAYEQRILSPSWRKFASFLYSIRIYDAWWLNALRQPAAHIEDGDSYLHRTGRNLLAVLNRWKNGDKRLQRQYEWVIRTARDAFFDFFEDLRIESEGSDYRGYFYPVGLETEVGLPLLRAPDGLLVGLLHLTAVAGAQDGSIVGLDEMENQLHPHAIRVLLKAMRERAEDKHLTILLTTHSPVLMNEFRGERMEDFYLIEQSAGTMPRRLTEAYPPEWLAQFLPGDLYENLKVAKPKRPA